MENTNKSNGEFPLSAIGVVIALYAGYRAVLVVTEAVEMLLRGLVVVVLCATALLAAFWLYQYLSDKYYAETIRIAKDRRREIKREKEKNYFESKDQSFMTDVVNNHYDDEARKLYDKKDHLVEAATFVKKVRDIFK